MHAQSCSTLDVPAAQRMRYWENAIAPYFGRLRGDDDAGGPDFEARCDIYDVGGLGAVRMQVPLSRVTREARDALDSGGGYFKLSMQIAGAADVHAANRTVHLGPGDWIMLDQRLPYTWESAAPASLFGLQIPRERLAALGLPSLVCSSDEALADSGMAPILGGHLRTLNTQLAHVTGDAAHLLAEASIGLLATTLSSGRPHARAPVDALAAVRLRAVQYVRLHASEATLSVDAIAHALRCSRRYLYKAFDGSDASPDRLIWQTRLERCHEALRDARNQARPVSSIAFENGFNSDAHFARMFRARYGQSPARLRRSLRAQAQGSRSS